MEKTISSDRLSLKEVLKILIKQKNKEMSGSELAKKVNLPVAIVNRLLSGSVTDPRVSTILPLVDFFNISVDQILGRAPLSLSQEMQEQFKPSVRVPVVSLTDLETVDLKVNDNHTYYTYLIENKESGSSKKTFAIKIKNDDFSPVFTKDTILIVNPQLLPPQHGDYLLVKFKKTKQHTIKKLYIDPPNHYLTSLITTHESVLYNPSEHAIIGVLYEAYTKLR